MRFLLIVNPKSGRNHARRRGHSVGAALEAGGHTCLIEETRGPMHAAELASAARESWDAIVAVGGDGTLHEVITGLMEGEGGPRPALGIVPAGSGDSVAMDLGIHNERQAAERLLAGKTGTIDLARIDLEATGDLPRRTLFAANVLAWGAGARINRRAERMRWAGQARYNLATVVELMQMGRGPSIPKVDGEPTPGDLLGVASLTRYSGRGLLLAPEAKLNDGKIDLVQIARSSRLHLARTFRAVFTGSHLELQGVRWRQAESFALELGQASELVVDGELVPCDKARITVLQERLTVFR